MDTIDDAQEREAAYLAERLERQARAAKLDARGNELCADCAEPIPEERRRALPSAQRCVPCQAWAERVAKIPNLSVA
jgi:phage/conjugal plasmid C-4 type zinc finger TraR family protein